MSTCALVHVGVVLSLELKVIVLFRQPLYRAKTLDKQWL